MKIFKIVILSFVFTGLLGCNSSGGSEEPAPKGAPPEIKQAEPGQVPPDQRRSGGGGEGDR